MNQQYRDELKGRFLKEIKSQGIENFTYALIEALGEMALSYSEHSKVRRLWLSLSSVILLSLHYLSEEEICQVKRRG